MIRGADGAWKWKNCFKSSLMKRKTIGVVHNNLKKKRWYARWMFFVYWKSKMRKRSF